MSLIYSVGVACNQLSSRGELVGAHDLWIAATALAHGYGVATGNAEHFERVPGLRVIAAGPA